MTDRELMQQALDALENLQGLCTDAQDGWVEAVTIWTPEIIAALRERLAQPEQGPVACQHKRYSVDVHEQTGRCFDCGAEGRMRFIVGEPTQQQRKPLPTSEVERLIYEHTKINPNVADDRELLGYIVNAARAIEAAYGIKGEA